MKTNEHIQDKITKTLNVTNEIQQVKVSPFFKDKVMQQLFAEKEEKQSVFSWFTPQLQLATLVCLVILNVFAITQLNADDSNVTDIEEFAQTYNLSMTDEVSLFN